MESIGEKVLKLKKELADFAADTGKAKSLTLVLVSKTVEPARILEAFNAGIQDFGENRVQELLKKKKELPGAIKWHMIGHLQTNKVKDIIGACVLIHSLDRIDLASEIDKQARLKGIARVPCLIQVNTSGEGSKFGLKPDAVAGFVKAVLGYPKLSIQGLMTIGPLSEDNSRIRSCFRMLKDLQIGLKREFPELSLDILSMGMSGDYRVALEEGSTMIRVGSAVFGSRK